MKVYKVFAKRPKFISELSHSCSPSYLDTFRAYESETHAYTEMYKSYRQGVKKMETRKSFERKIEAISLGTPQAKSFSIQRPTRKEIEVMLEVEAKAKLHGTNPTLAEIQQYIQAHFDEVEKDREAKWNEARKLFYDLDSGRLEREKQQLQREYQQKRQDMLDILNGEPYAIEKGMEDLCASIDVPLDFDFTYTYEKENNRVAVEIEIINGIQIPLQKAVRLQSGRPSIKNKLVREINEETKDTILSFAFLFASKVFEISLNIEFVEVTIWKEGRDAAYCWIEFTRDGIMRDNPRYLVPAFDYVNYRRVIDIRQKTASVEIATIPATKFQKQVDVERLKIEPVKVNYMQQERMTVIALSDAEELLKQLGEDFELESAINEAKAKRTKIVGVHPRYKQMIADAATTAIYGQTDLLRSESRIAGSQTVDRDPLFERAARVAGSSDFTSTSSLQRTFEIGYNRAGRLMDQLEAAGIVEPATGGKPRKVLMSREDIERLFKS